MSARNQRPVLIVTDMWPSESERSSGPFVYDEVAQLGRSFRQVVAYPRLLGRRVHARVWDGVEGWQRKPRRPPAPNRLIRYPIVRFPKLGETVVRSWSMRLRLQLAREHPQLVHGHFLFRTAAAAGALARALRVPLVLTAHGTDVRMLEGELPERLRAEVVAACRAAHTVLAVSPELAGRLAQLVPEARVDVLPMGVDEQVFSPAARCDGTAEPPFVLFVGRAVTEKGIAVLDEALGLLAERGRPVPGYIVGRGDTPSIRLQSVGELPQGEVAAWIAAASVLCLPSFAEGSPLAVLEALACGTPVVATRVGGIPEQVTPGDNGFLVEPGDAEGLADALARTLEREWNGAELRESSRGFWWSSLAPQLSAVYDDAIADFRA